MTRPIIIGGGVAGLMAALHLAERGLAPLLLEADADWIGGRLRGGDPVTLEHAGRTWQFPGEHGVHGIWSPYVNLKAALARRGILPDLHPAHEETWIDSRRGRVGRAPIGSAIRGSPLPAPFHYLYCFLRPSFLNMLGLRDLLALPRVLMTLFAAMAIDPLAERKALQRASLADFTRHWSPGLRNLFAGLARSGLSALPEQVPASGWIAFLRFYTLLRRDAWAFDYLPGTGGDCVTEPLAAEIRRLGAQIELGCRVVRLERRAQPEQTAPGRWQVSYTRQGEPGETGETSETETTIEADYVILAVDAPAAARLLADSPATTEAAAALRFPVGTPSAIVRLWFGAQPRRGSEAGIYTGDVVMDNFFWLHRLQPTYAEWSQATGGSALEMHIYSTPDLLDQPDAALLARAVTDTRRAFPELADHLLRAVLVRNEPTHTLFGVGEPGEHLSIATPWPGLFACGDWVYHPTPALFLERATVTGIAAANAVLEDCKQAPWPLLAHPQPEWLAGKVAALLRRGRIWALQRRQARGQS